MFGYLFICLKFLRVMLVVKLVYVWLFISLVLCIFKIEVQMKVRLTEKFGQILVFIYLFIVYYD